MKVGACPRCGKKNEGSCTESSVEFWCAVCEVSWVEALEPHGPPCWTLDIAPSPTQEVQLCER